MGWMLAPGSGELFWPLGEDQTTHLRVWQVGHEWHAALVFEGDYMHHILPQPTIKAAQEALILKLAQAAAAFVAMDAERRLG